LSFLGMTFITLFLGKPGIPAKPWALIVLIPKRQFTGV